MLKKDFGGLWEVTAGSILAGETSKQGAIRELKEETGIIINEEDANLLGTLKEESCFTDIYITKYNFDITKVILQEGETIDVKKVTLDQLYGMIENSEVPIPNVQRIEHVKISLEEFIKLIQKDRQLQGIDIAKYILSKIKCTQLKLQKLVYLCFADYLCDTGKKLFTDKIYAFKYGPVVDTVYKKYREYGYKSIDDETGDIDSKNISEMPSKSRILFAEDGTEKISSIEKTLQK